MYYGNYLNYNPVTQYGYEDYLSISQKNKKKQKMKKLIDQLKKTKKKKKKLISAKMKLKKANNLVREAQAAASNAQIIASRVERDVIAAQRAMQEAERQSSIAQNLASTVPSVAFEAAELANRASIEAQFINESIDLQERISREEAQLARDIASQTGHPSAIVAANDARDALLQIEDLSEISDELADRASEAADGATSELPIIPPNRRLGAPTSPLDLYDDALALGTPFDFPQLENRYNGLAPSTPSTAPTEKRSGNYFFEEPFSSYEGMTTKVPRLDSPSFDPLTPYNAPRLEAPLTGPLTPYNAPRLEAPSVGPLTPYNAPGLGVPSAGPLTPYNAPRLGAPSAGPLTPYNASGLDAPSAGPLTPYNAPRLGAPSAGPLTSYPATRLEEPLAALTPLRLGGPSVGPLTPPRLGGPSAGPLVPYKADSWLEESLDSLDSFNPTNKSAEVMPSWLKRTNGLSRFPRFEGPAAGPVIPYKEPRFEVSSAATVNYDPNQYEYYYSYEY